MKARSQDAVLVLGQRLNYNPKTIRAVAQEAVLTTLHGYDSIVYPPPVVPTPDPDAPPVPPQPGPDTGHNYAPVLGFHVEHQGNGEEDEKRYGVGADETTQ